MDGRIPRRSHPVSQSNTGPFPFPTGEGAFCRRYTPTRQTPEGVRIQRMDPLASSPFQSVKSISARPQALQQFLHCQAPRRYPGLRLACSNPGRRHAR
jgi:hypothetical protein